MATQKLVAAIALFMGLSTTAVFAGDKGAKDDTKSEAKAEAPATATPKDRDDDDVFYYKVVSLSGGQYTLQSETEEQGDCPGGSNACEISCTHSLSSPISQTVVDGQQQDIIVLGNRTF